MHSEDLIVSNQAGLCYAHVRPFSIAYCYIKTLGHEISLLVITDPVYSIRQLTHANSAV